jgi:hypothetical protein
VLALMQEGGRFQPLTLAQRECLFSGMAPGGLSWRAYYRRAYAHYYGRSHVDLSPNVPLRSLECLSSKCTTFPIFITDT